MSPGGVWHHSTYIHHTKSERSVPMLKKAPPSTIIKRGNARVAEWQTRRTQNPLFARTCGFDSHPGHNHKNRHRKMSFFCDC